MEPKFQSSFIPKGPLATSGTATKISRESDKSFLATLAVFVFVFSILISAGGFGYEWWLRRDIAQMGDALKAAQNILESDSIKEITSLDQRIKSTGKILQSHTIASPLFAFLEESTLQQVRFTDFKYESTLDGMLNLTMRGEARGYAILAKQAEILSTSKYIKDISFSDLSLNDKGDVSFALKAKLDPSISSFVEAYGVKEEPSASGTVPEGSGVVPAPNE